MSQHQKNELRLAVSMAGGTSLALYMNGVAQQLFELSQAKPQDTGLYPLLLTLADYQQAKLDVFSGTSAGGMNAILLATALANGTDLNFTEELLITLADIHQLLEKSGTKPKSILQGEKVKEGLQKALERLATPNPAAASRWDIDLLVTGTHLAGRAREYADDIGSRIELIDHRAVFHFRHRVETHENSNASPSSDLRPTSKAEEKTLLVDRLATAGRVSSSLPAAFRPPAVLASLNPDDREIIEIDPSPSWMADGGYRNARPLDLVLDVVKKRKVTSEAVRRQVVLLEPVLERRRKDRTTEPNFVEHISLYHQIATAQDLEGTLRDLAHHNRYADLASQSTKEIRRQIAATDLKPESLADLVPKTVRVLYRQAVEDQASQLLHQTRPDEEVPPAGWSQQLQEILKLERKALRATDELYEAMRALVLIPDGKAGEWLDTLFGHYKAARELRESLSSKGQGPDPSMELQKLSEKIDRAFYSGLGELSGLNGEEPFARLHTLLTASGESEALASLESYFQVLDLLLFPMEYASGLSSQQKAEWAIFHADVRSGLATGKMEDKLAGEALMKLAGFLRESWRRNDICWGHIDGSTHLTRLLLEDKRTVRQTLNNDTVRAKVWAFLGFRADGSEPIDAYGRYLRSRSPALLETLRNSAVGDDRVTEALTDLLATRHHLSILEQKIPRLLVCEVLEAQHHKSESLGRKLLESILPERPWPTDPAELTRRLEERLANKGDNKLLWLVEAHSKLTLGDMKDVDISEPPLSAPLDKAVGLGLEIAFQGAKGSPFGLFKIIWRGLIQWVKGSIKQGFLKRLPAWAKKLLSSHASADL